MARRTGARALVGSNCCEKQGGYSALRRSASWRTGTRSGSRATRTVRAIARIAGERSRWGGWWAGEKCAGLGTRSTGVHAALSSGMRCAAAPGETMRAASRPRSSDRQHAQPPPPSFRVTLPRRPRACATATR
eukprot:3704516-Prymnesium_polylepis.1